MTDFPNIIGSKIIEAEWNQLWKELPMPENISKTAEVLVISAGFEPGGAEEMQLQKMMQACQLDGSGYNVFQPAGGEMVAWHQLRDAFRPKYVLLLGIHPQQLGISALFHLFAPNHFNDVLWIAGPSLQEMESQPEAKKQLWLNGLKPVFVDKSIN
jgi:hypothetical protein